MVVDPAEAKTKEDEGGGQRLEPADFGHEFLDTVQLLWEFSEAEVWRTEGGAQKSEASVVSNLPPVGASGGWISGWRSVARKNVLALHGVPLSSWRSLSTSLFWKPGRPVWHCGGRRRTRR